VQDEEAVVVEREDDPLAEAAHAAHDSPVQHVERRVDRAQYEWAQEPNLLETVADHACGQGLNVDCDIGQFGHGNPGWSLVVGRSFRDPRPAMMTVPCEVRPRQCPLS
jgi:hypothetical protein